MKSLSDLRFTVHAQEEIKDRGIKRVWIQATIGNPDQVKRVYGRKQGRRKIIKIHYLKRIKEYGNHWLRVIIDPNQNPEAVITLYFDSNLP